jgi:hypothetical protein
MGCAPESGWRLLVCALEVVVDRRHVLLLTNTDNAQTLMDEDSVVGDVVAAPVGAAVLDLLAHADGRGPELLHIGVPVLLSVCLPLRQLGV